MTTPEMIDAAERFLSASGRVLDRRRFDLLFRGGDAGALRAAVAAYRNPDGGLGSALEPDLRTPASQPAAIELGLRTLHEAGAWDDALARDAVAWLAAHAPAAGGAVFAEPTLDGWPHAPWWQPEATPPPSLVLTGLIAGTLHARGWEDPWLTRATELMWAAVEGLERADPYEMRGVLRFLQHVPDRARAERAMERVGRVLLAGDLVAMDPAASGEVHRPLDYAPEPGSLARRLFAPSVIEAHLVHLAASQREDGGWMFNWQAWSKAAELEWRGCVTVDALMVLRANGRL